MHVVPLKDVIANLDFWRRILGLIGVEGLLEVHGGQAPHIHPSSSASRPFQLKFGAVIQERGP